MRILICWTGIFRTFEDTFSSFLYEIVRPNLIDDINYKVTSDDSDNHINAAVADSIVDAAIADNIGNTVHDSSLVFFDISLHFVTRTHNERGFNRGIAGPYTQEKHDELSDHFTNTAADIIDEKFLPVVRKINKEVREYRRKRYGQGGVQGLLNQDAIRILQEDETKFLEQEEALSRVGTRALYQESFLDAPHYYPDSNHRWWQQGDNWRKCYNYVTEFIKREYGLLKAENEKTSRKSLLYSSYFNNYYSWAVKIRSDLYFFPNQLVLKARSAKNAMEKTGLVKLNMNPWNRTTTSVGRNSKVEASILAHCPLPFVYLPKALNVILPFLGRSWCQGSCPDDKVIVMNWRSGAAQVILKEAPNFFWRDSMARLRSERLVQEGILSTDKKHITLENQKGLFETHPRHNVLACEYHWLNLNNPFTYLHYLMCHWDGKKCHLPRRWNWFGDESLPTTGEPSSIENPRLDARSSTTGNPGLNSLNLRFPHMIFPFGGYDTMHPVFYHDIPMLYMDADGFVVPSDAEIKSYMTPSGPKFRVLDHMSKDHTADHKQREHEIFTVFKLGHYKEGVNIASAFIQSDPDLQYIERHVMLEKAEELDRLTPVLAGDSPGDYSDSNHYFLVEDVEKCKRYCVGNACSLFTMMYFHPSRKEAKKHFYDLAQKTNLHRCYVKSNLVNRGKLIMSGRRVREILGRFQNEDTSLDLITTTDGESARVVSHIRYGYIPFGNSDIRNLSYPFGQANPDRIERFMENHINPPFQIPALQGNAYIDIGFNVVRHSGLVPEITVGGGEDTMPTILDFGNDEEETIPIENALQSCFTFPAINDFESRDVMVTYLRYLLETRTNISWRFFQDQFVSNLKPDQPYLLTFISKTNGSNVGNENDQNPILSRACFSGISVQSGLHWARLSNYGNMVDEGKLFN